MISLPRELTASRSEFENYCRSKVNFGYYDEQTILANILGGVKVLLPKYQDESLCAASDGFWCAWASLVITRSLRPGDVAFDYAATSPYWSALMALCGARTVCTVRSPHEYDYFLRINSLNGFDTTYLHTYSNIEISKIKNLNRLDLVHLARNGGVLEDVIFSKNLQYLKIIFCADFNLSKERLSYFFNLGYKMWYIDYEGNLVSTNYETLIALIFNEGTQYVYLSRQ